MLDIHPTIKGASLLGAHWNRKGNIVVSFLFGTPETTALALRPGIRAALHLPDSVEITIDKPWSKLMVSSVPARLAPGAPVFSEADLIYSFSRNPVVKDVKITRPPRWICNPANIQGAHLSFVFSFKDPDGSMLRRLRQTPLFVFGAPVSAKRWQETPKPHAAPRPTPGSHARGPVPTTQPTGVDNRMETV
jgi:hypothetical protein